MLPKYVTSVLLVNTDLYCFGGFDLLAKRYIEHVDRVEKQFFCLHCPSVLSSDMNLLLVWREDP
jgi:hypothetical protein